MGLKAGDGGGRSTILCCRFALDHGAVGWCRPRFILVCTTTWVNLSCLPHSQYSMLKVYRHTIRWEVRPVNRHLGSHSVFSGVYLHIFFIFKFVVASYRVKLNHLLLLALVFLSQCFKAVHAKTSGQRHSCQHDISGKSLRVFLHIWHRCLFGHKYKLIRIWWSKTKGQGYRDLMSIQLCWMRNLRNALKTSIYTVLIL